MDALTFIVIAFAVFRLTSLLHRESGPFAIFDKFRYMIGIRNEGGRIIARNELAEAFICFMCLSVWIALPFALVFFGISWEAFLYWLAFSGAAILIERV